MNLRNSDKDATGRAKTFRETMNRSERLLWSRINAGKTGFKFRRQYPVGPYVLDFYCPEALLCVELDGDCHTERETTDRLRDETLAELGIETLRIGTAALWPEIDGFVGLIRIRCEERVAELGVNRTGPPPTPPP